MGLTGNNYLIKLRQSIENSLAERYKTVFIVDGARCLEYGNVFFKISNLTWKDTQEDVILAEYADSKELAKKNLFADDGKMFYTNEMSEEDIVKAIIEEVEES